MNAITADNFIEKMKKKNDTAVIIANEKGLITYVNLLFENIFLWKISEIINQSITMIIPERFHDAHNLGLSRFLTTEQPNILNKPLLLPAINKNGQEFKAKHTIYAKKINEQWVLAATIEVVTNE